MVTSDLEMQRKTGLYRGMLVRVRVTAHRGRFGVDVEIISREIKFPAFVDAVLLFDDRSRAYEECFPEVGSEISAIVVAFTPDGELRLDARESIIKVWNEKRDTSPSDDI